MKSKHIKKTSRVAIISFIFAILGVLFFYSFLYQIVSLCSIYRPLQITCGLVFTFSFTLALVALVLIAFNRRILRGSLFPILSLFICAVLLFMWIPLRTSLARHRRGVVGSKIANLYSAITEYSAEHDGYLPSADEWCSLLIEHNKSLSKDSFRYPPGKYGFFIFAFNKNLDGLRFDDIPNDVVLLFEHDMKIYGQNNRDKYWNLAGGSELLKYNLKENKEFRVLLANGRTYLSMPSMRKLFDEKLQWEPKDKQNASHIH